jgi:class 3 adenylate cyclase
MADLQNRTLICSVLFIDIVEYSRKPVAEQIQLKDRFNALISDALRGVAVNDRIILDTGDGAAISFIGDPEDALFVGTGLRDQIGAQAEAGEVELSTRMGINLGPVRLVKDINGQPNIIGDGINVAQRVMTFAKPGQVLVSRSYYEVVSRLSDESSRLFSYEGSRTDKHIREHEVYAVGAIPAVHRRTDHSSSPGWNLSAEAGSTPGFTRISRKAKDIADQVVAKPRLATLLSVLAILVTAFGARAYREPPYRGGLPSLEISKSLDGTRTAATASPPAVSQPETAAPAPPSAPVADASSRAASPAPADVAPSAVAAVPDSQRSETQPRADSRRGAAVAVAEPQAAVPDARPLPQAAEAQLAVLSLAIAPWGHVFVDGKPRGVSPPLRELELAPGKHRIELKNTGSQTHVVTVNAKPGEKIRIKHKFN